MSIPVIPITEREFDLYALSLPRGPNFDPLVLHSAWKSRDRRSVGAVLFDPQKQDFGIVTLRRQIDHRFVVTHQHQGLRTPYDAKRGPGGCDAAGGAGRASAFRREEKAATSEGWT